MEKNVGNTDRVLRLLLAAGAVAGSGVLGFSGAWGIVLLVVAGVLVVTGTTGFCPAYSLFKVDTLHHDEVGTPHLGPFHAHRMA
jgi:hypothetical protein